MAQTLALLPFPSLRSPSPDLNPRTLFSFGAGFVARYVSRRLATEHGWKISGTCTTVDKKRELEDLGFDAFVFDTFQHRLEDLTSLPYATHILVSVPPLAGAGDPLLPLLKELSNNMSSGDGNLRWLCYLSSTSVYGDCNGALVTEDYLANPYSNSAKERLAAEQGWLALGNQLGVSTYIFRLGGIYGPGRSALDTMIKGGSLSSKQILRKSKRYTARIHVTDIYQAIKASIDVPTTGRVYNVVDDDPAPRAEVFAFAQSLLKEKRPDLLQGDSTGDYGMEVAKVMYEDVKAEKIVLNTRLKDELSVNFIHPTYRSGLRSILASYEATEMPPTQTKPC